MIALLTTARKATLSALAAFLSPPTALLLSDQPITWRVMLASLLVGALAGLGVYETGNTEEYEPRHAVVQDAD
ncbi:hypothetical protein [Blastococcus sp. CT_GayMR16]|uniref:hypothetical protein n=1 Tax=Blastococcus sp. CT_GayMR16 TaxID=2559607 RepID=UPI0010737566|nr:hypothetical protein [Blastococcus sp. CT_GayMR16]TFV83172.1 hypothetical protein E4P38_21180 [Blastococcus sp. CT_GayMR16]